MTERKQPGGQSGLFYQVFTRQCDAKDGNCTLAGVFEDLRRNPAPCSENRPVDTGDVTNVPFLGSVSHTVDAEGLTVTNTTQEGHLLHPGEVVHHVVERDGQIGIETTGTGPFGAVNEALANLVWTTHFQPRDGSDDVWREPSD